MKRLILTLSIIATLSLNSCSNDDTSNQPQKLQRGYEEVTDKTEIEEVLNIASPANENESYSHPNLLCFHFTSPDKSSSHAIVEYLGIKYTVFGTKKSDGSWSLSVYYSLPGETC